MRFFSRNPIPLLFSSRLSLTFLPPYAIRSTIDSIRYFFLSIFFTRTNQLNAFRLFDASFFSATGIRDLVVSMFIARSFEVIDGKESFNDKEIFISLTWCNVIKASDIELLDLFRNNILYTDQAIDLLPLSKYRFF